MPYITFIIISLTVFWLLLSGFWDNGLLLALGAVSVALVGYLTWQIERQHPTMLSTRILLLLPVFLVWLIGEIIKANIDVLKRIWFSGRYPVEPIMKSLPMSQKGALGKTIYANAITLTPGTVSVDVVGDRVLVHAVSAEGIAGLEEGEMDRRVTALEGKTT
ncbi:MAG: Cation transporter [uncultured Thiotrichaceae bacterium]|uniref:Cation transporter n=1 Tax=uncultured Thiotrichaceae bacterium TaxID=298394 RepID=A0A6S6S6Z5_9GAMM|nr:MAG: Cation transporter [uncultured Thiotrichaceae bacterium]